MIDAMITADSDSMITWFSPASSPCRAAGNSTSHIRWRGVQPTIVARSVTDGGRRRSASVVLRAIGGMA